MGFTEGRWEQGTSNGDLQVFIGAPSFMDSLAHAVPGSGAGGYVPIWSGGASLQCTYFANLGCFLRTGIYATPAFDQEQFGTAAGVPGPSQVANTGGPLGLPPGFPPLVGSSLSTIAGSINAGSGIGIQRGPIPKGMQIDSIDVIYSIGLANATVATVGLTKTVFVNNTAPATTNLIALGVNGMQTTAQANPYVINVPVTTPVMITSADTEVVCNVNLTAGATGLNAFYGIVVHYHYNFN